MVIGEPGKPANMSVSWTAAQTSVRGMPGAPERASIVVDNPELTRAARATMEPFAAAKHLELHGRVLPHAANQSPSVQLALRLNAAAAPLLHPAAAQPTDAEIDLVVSGLRDLGRGRSPPTCAISRRRTAS